MEYKISDLFGFIVQGEAIALVTTDAMIDLHQGNIARCVVGSLSRYVDAYLETGADFTIINDAPIAITVDS